MATFYNYVEECERILLERLNKGLSTYYCSVCKIWLFDATGNPNRLSKSIGMHNNTGRHRELSENDELRTFFQVNSSVELNETNKKFVCICKLCDKKYPAGSQYVLEHMKNHQNELHYTPVDVTPLLKVAVPERETFENENLELETCKLESMALARIEKGLIGYYCSICKYYLTSSRPSRPIELTEDNLTQP